jgi:uncharacterized membrane protein YgcG
MPGYFTVAQRSFWSRLIFVLALLILGMRVSSVHAQEIESEIQDEISPVPCPPGFPASYTDPVFGTLWGYSRLTMVQEDEYHTYKFYTYEFSGRTSDGSTGVKGIHHVNAQQCLDAAFAFWFGIPAVIGTMHNAVFTNNEVACGGDGDGGDLGSGGGEHMESYSCDGGGSDGGGTQEGGTAHCWTLTVDHYWYYPDTGRVEYRYSESYTWCEQAS